MATSIRTDIDNILHIGQRVTLTTPHYNRPIEGELLEIGVLYLGIAVEGLTTDEYTSAPTEGSPIGIKFLNRNGLYQATLKYRGNALIPQRMFYLEKPKAIEHQQQRQHVRVPADLPVHYMTKRSDGRPDTMKDAALVDISGGGLCFLTDSEIACPSTVSLIIDDLPDMGKLLTSADVLRCQEIKTPTDTPVYNIGASFGDYLTRADHSRLVKALTVLQRNHLRKNFLNRKKSHRN